MRIPKHPLFWTVVAGVVGLPGLLDDIGTWEKWLTMEGWKPWRYWSVFTGALIIVLAWRSTVERWFAKIAFFSGDSTLKEDSGSVRQLLDSIDRKDREIEALRKELGSRKLQESDQSVYSIDEAGLHRGLQRTPKQLTALVAGKMDIEAKRLSEPYIGMDMVLRAKVADVIGYHREYVIEATSEDGTGLSLTCEKDKTSNPD